MAITPALTELAQAWFAQQRQKLGLDKVAQDAQAATDESALRRAQATRALGDMETPEERAAKIDLQKAQAEQARAHGTYYTTPHGAGNTGTLQPLLSGDGTVVGFYLNKPGAAGVQYFSTDGRPVGGAPDGAAPAATAGASTPSATPSAPASIPSTFRTKAVPPPKTGAPGRPQLRQSKDAQGNAVWTWITPGQEGVAVAPTANERQAAGMAATVKENVEKMKALADEVTTGPIAGRASRASQAIFGPHGPEGDFDFYGNTAVDLVYIKSGKQINETELGTLRQMIPNRSRGNLRRQVELFDDYANSLLRKYGAAEPTSAVPPPAADPGGAQTRIINGVTYVRGAGPDGKPGWKRQ